MPAAYSASRFIWFTYLLMWFNVHMSCKPALTPPLFPQNTKMSQEVCWERPPPSPHMSVFLVRVKLSRRDKLKTKVRTKQKDTDRLDWRDPENWQSGAEELHQTLWGGWQDAGGNNHRDKIPGNERRVEWHTRNKHSTSRLNLHSTVEIQTRRYQNLTVHI